MSFLHKILGGDAARTTYSIPRNTPCTAPQYPPLNNCQGKSGNQLIIALFKPWGGYYRIVLGNYFDDCKAFTVAISCLAAWLVSWWLVAGALHLRLGIQD